MPDCMPVKSLVWWVGAAGEGPVLTSSSGSRAKGPMAADAVLDGLGLPLGLLGFVGQDRATCPHQRPAKWVG